MERKSIGFLVLVSFFLLSVCASSCRKGNLRMPAKLDEPIKRGDNVVQHDEPIRLGNTSKGAKEEIYNPELRKQEREMYSLCNKPTLKVVKTIKVKPTGYYTPEKGQGRYAQGSFQADLAMNGSGKKTASGKKPEAMKTVAVDKKIIPHGTRLKIEGYQGIFEAQDSGKNIKGRRIDIFFGKGEWALRKALAVDNKKFITVEVLAPSS